YDYSFDSNNVGAGQFDFQGIAMHEISEIMGRIAGLGFSNSTGTPGYLASDLFRYSGSGARGLTNGAGVQFSLNGGATLLKPYNNAAANGGDAGDWARSATVDSFDAFGGTEIGRAHV